MKTILLALAFALSATMLSITALAEAPKDPALYKEVASQFKDNRRQLGISIQTICKKRPDLCKSTSNTLQLGCSRMSCRLPRNAEEVLGHAECIENWLLSCL